MSGGTAALRRRCCCEEPKTVYKLTPCVDHVDRRCTGCTAPVPRAVTVTLEGVETVDCFSLFIAPTRCHNDLNPPPVVWCDYWAWGTTTLGNLNGAHVLRFDTDDEYKALLDPVGGSCRWVKKLASYTVTGGYSWTSGCPGTADNWANYDVWAILGRSGSRPTASHQFRILVVQTAVGDDWYWDRCQCKPPTGGYSNPTVNTIIKARSRNIFSAVVADTTVLSCVAEMDGLTFHNEYRGVDWYPGHHSWRPAHSGKAMTWVGDPDSRCPGGEPVFTDTKEVGPFVGYVIEVEGVCYKVSEVPFTDQDVVAVTITKGYLDCEHCCDAA